MIVAAEGLPIRSMADLQAIVRSVPDETPVVYTVERGSRLRAVTVRTMRFGWDDLFMTFGITFIAGLIYVAIGAVVFVLKPDTTVSWAFFSACLSLSLFAITSFDVQSTHAGFIRIYLVANAVWPAAFVHLAMVFPDRRAFVERRPALQAAPYIVAAILAVLLEALYPRPAFLAVYQVV